MTQNDTKTGTNVTLEAEQRRIYKAFRQLYDAEMSSNRSRRMSERGLIVDEILAKCMAIVYGDKAQSKLNYPQFAQEVEIKRFEWFKPEE